MIEIIWVFQYTAIVAVGIPVCLVLLYLIAKLIAHAVTCGIYQARDQIRQERRKGRRNVE